MHAGDLLSAFADGQLPADERRPVEAHLLDCRLCRDELAVITDMRQRVRSLPEVVVPPGTYELEADVIPIRRKRRPLVAAVAAVALVVGFAVSVNGNQTVPLELNEVVDQHVARASVDPGFNVLQVQAVANR